MLKFNRAYISKTLALCVVAASSSLPATADDMGMACQSDEIWRPAFSISYDTETLKGSRYTYLSTIDTVVREDKRKTHFDYYNDFAGQNCTVSLNVKRGRIKEYCGGEFQGENNFQCQTMPIPKLSSLSCAGNGYNVDIDVSELGMSIKAGGETQQANVDMQDALAFIRHRYNAQDCLIRMNLLTKEASLFCEVDNPDFKPSIANAKSILTCK